MPPNPVLRIREVFKFCIHTRDHVLHESHPQGIIWNALISGLRFAFLIPWGVKRSRGQGLPVGSGLAEGSFTSLNPSAKEFSDQTGLPSAFSHVLGGQRSLGARVEQK